MPPPTRALTLLALGATAVGAAHNCTPGPGGACTPGVCPPCCQAWMQPDTCDGCVEAECGKPAGSAPSVLFASPSFGTSNVYVNLEYLRSLLNDTSAPLQVDYTSSLAQLNRSRIFAYNALVLYSSPTTGKWGQPDGGYDKTWAPLVAEYVSKGGGVLLFPSELDVDAQQMWDVTELFGVKLPIEQLVEPNLRNLAGLTHAPEVTIAFTDQVNSSHAVAKGVKSIWHAIAPACE